MSIKKALAVLGLVLLLSGCHDMYTRTIYSAGPLWYIEHREELHQVDFKYRYTITTYYQVRGQRTHDKFFIKSNMFYHTHQFVRFTGVGGSTEH